MQNNNATLLLCLRNYVNVKVEPCLHVAHLIVVQFSSSARKFLLKFLFVVLVECKIESVGTDSLGHFTK